MRLHFRIQIRILNTGLYFSKHYKFLNNNFYFRYSGPADGGVGDEMMIVCASDTSVEAL
jgi:hypothetical protein